MSKAWMGVVVLAAALAGCSSESDKGTAVANNTAAPAEQNLMIGNDGEPLNATAAVLEQTDAVRNVTFVRAIMDAGYRCDGVTSSTRTKDYQGLPAWVATCRDGSAHVLAVRPDGQVLINSRTQ